MAHTADTQDRSTATPASDDSRALPGATPAYKAAQATTGSPLGTSSAAPGSTEAAGAQQGEDMFGRVVQGAHETIDRLAEGAAPHVHKLQESVSSASDQLHQRAGQAREMSDQWAESLRCTVRDNPLAAVVTAVAVGVLLARLSQR